MNGRIVLVIAVAVLLNACTGLQQFPEHSKDYKKSLEELDPDYGKALKRMNEATGTPDQIKEKQRQIRNEEIDRRLAVIDANFREFEVALAKENVTADFLVTVVGVGVGAAGALVGQTTSQILSAVSGGLAGAQAAYGKAALYEKALSALLGQMIAGRNIILVRISEGRNRTIDEYPLSAAVHDLEAYYFAGSLPGAIIATSADAQVKNKKATDLLNEINGTAVTEERFAQRKDLQAKIDGLNAAKAKALITKIVAKFPEAKAFADAQYPAIVSGNDPTGDKAKTVLRRLVLLTVRAQGDTETWDATISSL